MPSCLVQTAALDGGYTELRLLKALNGDNRPVVIELILVLHCLGVHTQPVVPGSM